MFEYLTENLKEIIIEHGIVGLFIASIIGGTFIPVPLEGLILVAVRLGFSPASCAIATGLGSTIGASLTYFLGACGNKLIKSEKLNSFSKSFKKYGFFIIFAGALTPLPFDPIALSAGILRLDYSKFFIAALLGRIIRFAIIAYIGNEAFGLFL